MPGVQIRLLGSYFANVNKSAHKILVAERVDGLLGLIPCSVLHNPTLGQPMRLAGTEGQLTRIPT